jgi:hypothetical protein
VGKQPVAQQMQAMTKKRVKNRKVCMRFIGAQWVSTKLANAG